MALRRSRVRISLGPLVEEKIKKREEEQYFIQQRIGRAWCEPDAAPLERLRKNSPLERKTAKLSL